MLFYSLHGFRIRQIILDVATGGAEVFIGPGGLSKCAKERNSGFLYCDLFMLFTALVPIHFAALAFGTNSIFHGDGFLLVFARSAFRRWSLFKAVDEIIAHKNRP